MDVLWYYGASYITLMLVATINKCSCMAQVSAICLCIHGKTIIVVRNISMRACNNRSLYLLLVGMSLPVIETLQLPVPFQFKVPHEITESFVLYFGNGSNEVHSVGVTCYEVIKESRISTFMILPNKVKEWLGRVDYISGDSSRLTCLLGLDLSSHRRV